MASGSEKRSAPRQVFNKIIQYRLTAKEKETDRLVNRKLTGVCIDISQGGLRIITDFIIGQGQVLELSLPVDETDIFSPVFAQVMWSMPERGHISNGLRFLHTV